MLVDADRLPLARSGWVSDTSTGAVVSADGTISWYCPGRFDAPPAFFRIVDPVVGAALRVGPAGAPRSVRRAWVGTQSYDPATNILRTVQRGRESSVEVTDFLPWTGTADRPSGRVIRILRALRGPVDVELEILPGRAWGRPRRVNTWSEGIAFDGLAVRTGFPLEPIPLAPDRALWRGSVRLDSGERHVVTLDDLDDEQHRPLSVDDALRLAGDTSSAWQSWLAGLTYDGPYRAAVQRAALAVKSLTGYRDGAPVGAATTSLPRSIGGERNADGRWARWREAASTAVDLAAAGMVEDGQGAAAWLRAALAETELPPRTITDPEGGPAPAMEELGLPGWRRSQPVRTGVDAPGDDLDSIGDVAAAVRLGGPLTGDWGNLVALTDWLAESWSGPDVGRWELAGRADSFVASKLQCWFALDRLARVARGRHPLDLDAVGWQQQAGEILAWLEKDGIDPASGTLRRTPGDPERADASLLRVAWQGPWPADHPVVVTTVDRVVTRLTEGRLLRRYPPEVDDGLAGTDGADLVASLWAVRALAAVGRWEEAHERMEAVCGLGQPLGLLAEAADPVSGELLGNLPSTAAHLALIAAATALEDGPR